MADLGRILMTRGGRLLVGGAVAASVLLGLWIALRCSREQALANYGHAQIEAASDQAAPAAVREALALGEPGIEVLVAALASYRTVVANTAHQVLLEELNRWAELPPAEAAPKLARLSAALAAHVEHLGPIGRTWAAEIAEQIVRWPLEPEFDAAPLLGDCRSVLRYAVEPGGISSWKVRQAAEQLDPLKRAAQQEAASRETDRALAEVLAWSELPGGGLPVEPAEVARLPNKTATEPVAAQNDPARLPLEETEAAQPLHPQGTSPQPLAAPPAEPLPVPPRASRLQTLTVTVPVDAAPEELPELAKLDTLALIHLLRRDADEEKQKVEDELRRRGMGSIDLQIARQMADADVQVRMNLVEGLPRVAGVNAQPWLLWATKDEAAEVRFAALTILATSNDANLRRGLAQIAAADPDPKIRALGERLKK